MFSSIHTYLQQYSSQSGHSLRNARKYKPAFQNSYSNKTDNTVSLLQVAVTLDNKLVTLRRLQLLAIVYRDINAVGSVELGKERNKRDSFLTRSQDVSKRSLSRFQSSSGLNHPIVKLITGGAAWPGMLYGANRVYPNPHPPTPVHSITLPITPRLLMINSVIVRWLLTGPSTLCKQSSVIRLTQFYTRLPFI